MAWEWSHSGEAYEAAQENLNKLPKKTLDIIYAEWEAHTKDDDFDQSIYNKALKFAKDTLVHETLADDIWNRMCNLAICDNGGFDAWCCPYGCHTVSFSFENDD